MNDGPKISYPRFGELFSLILPVSGKGHFEATFRSPFWLSNHVYAGLGSGASPPR